MTQMEREMIKALLAVEEWWLREGMKHFTGAPYAMFAVREAIAKAAGQSSAPMENK